MPNLKESDPQEGCLWLAQSYFCKTKKNMKKIRQFSGTHLTNYCRVTYMESLKYVNLIEISQVVIEIRGVENGELAVPINNTLVCYMAFLAADVRPCVLIEHK